MLVETLDVGIRGQETGDRSQETGGGSAGAAPSRNATEGVPYSAEPSRNATEGVPYSAEPTRRRKRKPWAPDVDDHSIYEMVMLKGETQDFVAQLFGICQSTVSRIVERYEKWRAHAGPREDGGLDHAERKRAQRALTYQRNERIIRNCLRLAGEVERCAEVSKSTTASPDGGLAGQREIRFVNTMLERTGMASRFYRLAFRVGMEQLELVEQEPAVMPAGLSDEEEAEQEAQAAADREEIRAARGTKEEQERLQKWELQAQVQRAEEEAARSRAEAEQARTELAGVLELLAQTQRELKAAEQREEEREMGGRDSSRAAEELDSNLPIRAADEQAVVELKLHNLHNANGAENGASASGACGCDANRPPEENGAKLHNGRALTPALSQRERETAGEEPPTRLPRGETMRFAPSG